MSEPATPAQHATLKKLLTAGWRFQDNFSDVPDEEGRLYVTSGFPNGLWDEGEPATISPTGLVEGLGGGLEVLDVEEAIRVARQLVHDDARAAHEGEPHDHAGGKVRHCPICEGRSS